MNTLAPFKTYEEGQWLLNVSETIAFSNEVEAEQGIIRNPTELLYRNVLAMVYLGRLHGEIRIPFSVYRAVYQTHNNDIDVILCLKDEVEHVAYQLSQVSSGLWI